MSTATITMAQSHREDAPRRPSALRTFTTLAGSEMRLYVREWGMLVFAFVFPPMMMLILAGVFSGDDPEAFGPMDGSEFYVVSYLAVPIASIAFTALPVMMAGYAEQGILKRYAASGIRPINVVLAQAATCLVSVVIGSLLVLAVAAPVYGVPDVQQPLAVAVCWIIGALTLLTIGVALGLLVRSVRVANALGMAVFFPVYILGGGGPPPAVMTETMRDIADLLPLTHLTAALRTAWLEDGSPWGDLVWVLGWWGIAAAAVIVILGLRRRGV